MADCISYKNIPYYSDLILDYLSEKENLKFSYNRFPNLGNFKLQLQEKAINFPKENRDILVTALKDQYKNLNTSKLTSENIELLQNQNTFTIVTGHQLNLFTGPLYFFYKIISVINLTKQLKSVYPEYDFVPVYWLATEDHDFEEISFFNHKENKIEWKTDQNGGVGRFSTKGLEKVFEEFSTGLNSSENADYLRSLFENAYLKHDNLTDATRFIANEFFSDQGLVIIDGDDKSLKTIFSQYAKRELIEQNMFRFVGKTANKLDELGYNIQVNPREINLFYLQENSRDRIVETDGTFAIHETDLIFSKEEILEELKNHPERFSPNAIMRPLYQETILPNLCYIGGSGEIAYWLELKEYFKHENITFPILLIRNSALLISKKQKEKLKKLSLNQEDLFLKQYALLEKQTKRISEISIDFSPQREQLQKQFKGLYGLANQTDKSFYGAVAAQEKKQINGLNYLEKRLLKAQKKALKDQLARTQNLQDELFPNGNLQERIKNFAEFYEIYGNSFLEILFKTLKPLEMQFDIIEIED